MELTRSLCTRGANTYVGMVCQEGFGVGGGEAPGLEAVDYVIVVAGPAVRGFLGDGCVTVTVSADRRYVEDLVNSLHNS